MLRLLACIAMFLSMPCQIVAGQVEGNAPSPVAAGHVLELIRKDSLPTVGTEVMITLDSPSRSVHITRGTEGLSLTASACGTERDRASERTSSIAVMRGLTIGFGRISDECSWTSLSGSKFTDSILREALNAYLWRVYRLDEKTSVLFSVAQRTKDS